MIHVYVPATTANIGSGFDSFGASLSMWNEMIVAETDNGLKISIDEAANTFVPVDERNLFYVTLTNTLKLLNRPYYGFDIKMINRIPLARGLGSSASCIVGGILCANKLAGNVMSIDDMICLAARIEGHPDNILPAFLGGFTIGCMDGEKVYHSRMDIPTWLSFVVLIPNFTLSTKKARAVLPTYVNMSDAVFNLSRSALFVSSLITGSFENLAIALNDRLHQTYRKSLIPDFSRFNDKSIELNAIGMCISGAGPALLSLVRTEEVESFVNEMNRFIVENQLDWQAVLLTPADGAYVVEE